METSGRARVIGDHVAECDAAIPLADAAGLAAVDFIRLRPCTTASRVQRCALLRGYQTMLEHERQVVSEWPSVDELLHRTAAGWKLVTLEWEREAVSRRSPSAATIPLAANAPVEIPYGLRVSDDGFHLEDEPAERRVLMILLNSIVDDRPLSHAASDLNRAGYTTRQGKPWGSASVFNLLPRLIEAGPAIFASSDWIAQREKRARTP